MSIPEASRKDPAVVDTLFEELSGLHVRPEQLEFTADVSTDRLLGGGFGEVRRATLHPTSEPLLPDGTRACGEEQHIIVAVKRLKYLDSVGLERRKRTVVREIHLLSKALHPNIVPFRGFHVDFEESIAWLISDWEPLGNVLDYLQDHDVNIIERLKLLHDTAKALVYLHSRDPQICHGDIKAANVLVSYDRRAMLCDFGQARIIEDEGFKSLETSVDFRGSIPWCSPEVLDGKGASPEGDIWAFGCLVWEVSTGTIPFSDLPTKTAIMMAIVQRRLPQPQQEPFFQQVPRLGRFVKECWHKDTAGRPSAQDSCSVLKTIIVDPKTRRANTPGKASWLSRAFTMVTRRSDSSRMIAESADNTSLRTIRWSDSRSTLVRDVRNIPDGRGFPTASLGHLHEHPVASEGEQEEVSARSIHVFGAEDRQSGLHTDASVPSGVAPMPWAADQLSNTGTSLESGVEPSMIHESHGSGGRDQSVANSSSLTSLNSSEVIRERKISDASARTITSQNRSKSPSTSLTRPNTSDEKAVTTSSVQRFNPRLSDAASPPGYETTEIPSPAVLTPLSPGLDRFRRVVMKVIQSQVLVPSVKSDTTTTARRGSRKSTDSGPELGSSRDGSERYDPRPSRIAIVIPALKKLIATQYLTEHQGLVRHLQFSPDGRYLATCSWDRRALIWKVGDPFTVHRTLLHPGTGFIGQVAWAPSGSHLLTKTSSAVKLWAVESGVLIKTIHRKHKIGAVAWSPTGKTFACVQRDHVHIIDLQGKDLEIHMFERMEIHDVAFTPDERRLLVVATLSQTISGLVPSKSRAEKRILVYDLPDKEIESQVPVLGNVRDVTVSEDGLHCLVSYEDTAPPEVWRIDLVNKPGSDERHGRLALVHTYMPKTTVDFAGPSYFGGLADEFIICAGKQGDIHIWDRETGLLLHSLQGANMVDGTPEDLTGIAWNHNAPGQFMFASATHDGTVRIWTANTPPETTPTSRAESPAPMAKARIREVMTIGVDTA